MLNKQIIKHFSIFCILINSISLLNAIELKEGWNLVSFPYKESTFLSIQDKNIKSIWGYDGKWLAYSNDENYRKLLVENNITLLEKLEPSKGYWVQVEKDLKPDFAVLSAWTNNINITKGWNLIGTIEDTTSIFEIDPNALYWKYNNGWKHGANKEYNGFDKFSTFDKSDGIWVYSANTQTFSEDKRKKFLFIDENLIPQQVHFDGKESFIDGFIHTEYVGSTFDFNQTGFLPIVGVYFEDNQLVSQNIGSSNENYVIFLEKDDQVIFEDNQSDPLLVTDFRLNDYFKNFYTIKFLAIEALPITLGLISPNVIMIVSNVSMNQSLTLFFTSISKPDDLLAGEFIKGIEVTARDVYGKVVDHEIIDGQMNMKPIFKVSSIVTHPFIYAFNGNKWELIGPGYYKDGKVYSKNWYNKFTKYILVDIDEDLTYSKSLLVKNSNGQVLRDVLIVSNHKIVTSTNYDGNFTYIAPEYPAKLIAYKKGYKPKIIEVNENDNIVLEPLENISTISGIDLTYDNNLSLIYSIGPEDKRFVYDNNFIKQSENLTLKPTILAETKHSIYSTVQAYEDGYVFAASDSNIIKIDQSGNIYTIDQGKGLVYDGFTVKDGEIYYGTFGDNFTKIVNSDDATTDNSLSEAAFLDNGLSVVYKPIVTDSKIYIPLYNQDSSTNASILIKDKNLNNINLISNLGTPGKLSENENEIVFGTNNSKIIFIDKDKSIVSKSFDLNGTGIIAKVVELDDYYFALDLNGTLKKFNTDGTEIDSIKLTPSSVLTIKDNNLIIADFNGTVYRLDTNFNVNDFYLLDGGVIAEPIIYNDNIYFITENGSFYKDNFKIGTFNTKVTNINLIDNSLVFGCENGTVWKIQLDEDNSNE